MILSHTQWQFPLLPDVQAELMGRHFGVAHKEVYLIADDALEYFEPSDAVSDASCLVCVFPFDEAFEKYSWPVYGLPVTIVVGPYSLPMDTRIIQCVNSYQPVSTTLYMRDAFKWHGPYNYDVCARSVRCAA